MKKKIYFLAGLSECGKSQAGEWATENGIFRLKIIYFEKIIGLFNDLEMKTKTETEKSLDILYQDESKMINKFKDAIYDFMLSNKCEAISLESLYRANLAKAFLDDSRFKTEVIYIEADLEKRAQREQKKMIKNNQKVELNNVIQQIKLKDQFKISKGVLNVQKIATKIIENNGNLFQYKKEISKIFKKENTMEIKTVQNQKMLHQALKIRELVFSNEQKVPVHEEVDKYETLATHYLVYNSKNQPIATCRTRIYHDKIKIERVAVLKAYRGKKVGWQLMLHVENEAKQQGYQSTILSAQAQALPFYQRLDYQVISDSFLDSNIEHYLMEKTNL